MARLRFALLTLALIVAALPCGAAAKGAHSSVVGGSVAPAGAFPSMAALVQAGAPAPQGQFCGASIVAPSWVITAAHCVQGQSPANIDAVTGRTRLSDSAGERSPVSAIQVDPAFSPDVGSHDVALLQLAKPTSAPAIAIAPADPALTAPGAALGLAGWGLLTNSPTSVADDLHSATLLALASDICRSAYGPSFDPALMICAGSPGGLPDSCKGDSGGPLVSALGGVVRLVGVVSFGSDVCGDPISPGVYTRLSAEQAWIASVIGGATAISPTPSPQTALKTRIGRVKCGAVRCKVNLSVTGGEPAGVALRVLRHRRCVRGRCVRNFDRLVRARRVGSGRWRATLSLPLGAVRLSARPYDASGAPLGAVAAVSLRVTA